MVAVELHASWWTWTSGGHGIVAEHRHSRTILGTSERYHMLTDMSSHHVAILGVGVRQDVLDEIVAELVTSNVDERHTWALRTSLADAIQVLLKEIVTANLEALLNDLGRILIHAILGGKAEDVVDGTSPVHWYAVLTDVLDAPIAELAMRDNINVG